MKRKLCLISLLFLFVHFNTQFDLYAQGENKFSFGPKFGLNIASFLNEDYNGSSRLGIMAGGFLNYKINNIFSLNLESLYSMKGIKVNSTKVEIDYLEFPLLAKINFPHENKVKTFIYTGGALGYKVKAIFKNESSEFEYKDLVYKTDYSWIVGGGLDFHIGKRTIILDIRYTMGLKSFFNFNDPSDSDSDDKHQVISFGIGYGL